MGEVWEECGRSVEGVWEECGRGMGGVWEECDNVPRAQVNVKGVLFVRNVSTPNQ